MTRAYVFNNPCILAVNKAWHGVNLEANRKGLYTQIFFMFFIYFISQVLHAFRYKNSSNLRRKTIQHSLIPSRMTQINQQKQQPQQATEQQKPDLPWHQKRWNRNFSFMFSSHAVALGMVILFSPLAGGLVVAYFHLLAFMIYCFCEFRALNIGTKILRMVMDTLNLILMIIGVAGINYAQYCKDSFGNLVCCRNL